MPISTGEWPAMAQDTPRLLDPAVVVPLWRSTRWNARLSTDTTINASRRMIAVRFRSSPICLVEAGRPLAVRFLDRSTFFRNLRPGVRRLASWLATCTPCYWISESSVKTSARQGLRKRSFLIQRDTPISRLLHVCIFETLFFFFSFATWRSTRTRVVVQSWSIHLIQFTIQTLRPGSSISIATIFDIRQINFALIDLRSFVVSILFVIIFIRVTMLFFYCLLLFHLNAW